jgi:hypothetical protein
MLHTGPIIEQCIAHTRSGSVDIRYEEGNEVELYALAAERGEDGLLPALLGGRITEGFVLADERRHEDLAVDLHRVGSIAVPRSHDVTGHVAQCSGGVHRKEELEAGPQRFCCLPYFITPAEANPSRISMGINTTGKT